MKHVILITMIFAANSVYGAFTLLDQIAVVVDENIIMFSEVNDRLQSVKSNLANNPDSSSPPDNVLIQQVVERLIIEDLQLQIAERAGVRLSDSELNEALQRVAAQNNLTLVQFRLAIEADGMSYDSMREQVRREMILNQVQQGVLNSRIEISEQELKNFMSSELGEAVTSDEYRLAHILLTFPEDASANEVEEVRALAERLLQRINEGENFQSLAVEYSTGQNAVNGGEMGWRKPIQLPTLFSDIAPDMQVNDVRGPIQSGSGFHLVKLLEKRGARAQGQIPQTNVRHVLIQPNEIRTEREALELATDLRNEIINGRPFDEVAKLYSDDPGSALSGGDLGWNPAGTFVPEFEQTIQQSNYDVISEVFKTVHGYHFLEVTGRRIEDFTEQFRRSQAENYLRNQKFDEELDRWFREIREQAFVDIRI